MKILIGCSSSPDKGSGILSYSKEISLALINKGHEIHFACPVTKDHDWFESNKIIYFQTDQVDEPLQRAIELIDYINAEVDAVINNDNSLLQSIAPAIDVPFISVGHFGKTSIAALACYNHQYVDYVVSISNDMRHAFIKNYDVPAVKCPLVYNGVNNIKSNQSLEVTNGVLKVVYAGGGSKRKGADLVSKMLTYNSLSESNIELNWFGGMPNSTQQKLQKFNSVTVHGKVKRETFFNYLKEADVLLFPSREEGCPMAMLEAMSYGVIPIVSDGIGAMDSIITSGRNGFVCLLDNWSKQAYECLQHLSDMPAEQLMVIKAEALKDYQLNFRSENVALRLIGLIQNPTVNREKKPKSIEVLKWHRPFRKDKLKAPLLDRIAIKLGYLRKQGTLTL